MSFYIFRERVIHLPLTMSPTQRRDQHLYRRSRISNLNSTTTTDSSKHQPAQTMNNSNNRTRMSVDSKFNDINNGLISRKNKKQQNILSFSWTRRTTALLLTGCLLLVINSKVRKSFVFSNFLFL